MKVAVIADDLSGAAELASAAADLGYSAEVHTSFEPASSAEVVAVDTDSRAMAAGAAAEVVARVTRDLLRAGATWVYKKTDSVLRGNVRAEIEAVLKATGLRRALLVPANPSKGRIIRGGVYYVNGTPLGQTAFAADPDHPRRSSAVLELLGEAGATRVAAGCSPGKSIDEGIAVPDVEDGAGILRHAGAVDGQTLAAGGVEFFRAVLERRQGKRHAADAARTMGRPMLFVCGSAHAWSQGRLAQCERHRVPVLVMPDSVSVSTTAVPHGPLHEWSERITAALAAQGCALAAIGSAPVHGPPSHSTTLAGRLAAAVSGALQNEAVAVVCVEGGATAAALLRELGWRRLAALPSSTLDGVAVLRPFDRGAPLVLVKPGSYPWPDSIWQQSVREGSR